MIASAPGPSRPDRAGPYGLCGIRPQIDERQARSGIMPHRVNQYNRGGFEPHALGNILFQCLSGCSCHRKSDSPEETGTDQEQLKRSTSADRENVKGDLNISAAG